MVKTAIYSTTRVNYYSCNFANVWLASASAAQCAPGMMEVEVPAGLAAGDTMAVMLPDGATFEVIVPVGSASGSTILVEAPVPVPQGTAAYVEVTVPGGVAEGESFSVQMEDGAVFAVTLPPGLREGDTLEVEVPLQEEQRPAEAQSAPEGHGVQPAPPARVPPPCAEDTAPSPTSRSDPIPQVPSPSQRVGSNLNDRFSSSRQQQHFNHSSAGWTMGGGGVSSKFELKACSRAGADGRSSEEGQGQPTTGRAPIEHLTCRTDDLREPQPDDGCRFFVGQPVQLLRASGEWTEGTVLEMFHGYETLYRCRFHEGILEKMVSEDEVRAPVPDAGFRFYRGQPVAIERPNGLLENATVLSHRAERKANGTAEPWYRVRVAPSEVTPSAVVEQIHEDDLREPAPQLGCAFHVGQLVQAKRKVSSKRASVHERAWTLCRVVAFERVGYSLGYKCEVLQL